MAAGPAQAAPTLFLVDADEGSVATITAEELGLSDFGGVTLVRFGPDRRLVAWHGESSQVVTLSATGTAVRRIPLGLSSGFMAAPLELVAFDDASRVAVLRQRSQRSLFRSGGDEAPYRQQVTFSLVRPGGSVEPVVRAAGPERVYLAVREDSARGNVEADVIFGETVFSAPLGSDRLIVAETDADSIWVLDTQGNYEPLIPTPPRSVVVSEEDVRIERRRRKQQRAMDPEIAGLIDMVSGRHREDLVSLDRASRVAVDLAPVNRTPPAVAGLVVDGQSRLWLKRFAPPTDSVASWEVWNTTRAVVEHRLDAPRDWDVLDARGDRVLFRAESTGDTREGRGAGRLILVEIRPAGRQGAASEDDEGQA